MAPNAGTGLVQPQDKIVVRFTHTIYPYSLGYAGSVQWNQFLPIILSGKKAISHGSFR